MKKLFASGLIISTGLILLANRVEAQQLSSAIDTPARSATTDSDPNSSSQQLRFVEGEKGEKIFFLKNPEATANEHPENGKLLLPSRKNENEAVKPE